MKHSSALKLLLSAATEIQSLLLNTSQSCEKRPPPSPSPPPRSMSVPSSPSLPPAAPNMSSVLPSHILGPNPGSQKHTYAIGVPETKQQVFKPLCKHCLQLDMHIASFLQYLSLCRLVAKITTLVLSVLHPLLCAESARSLLLVAVQQAHMLIVNSL